MRNLVRNAATVVAAVGLAVSVAPAAAAYGDDDRERITNISTGSGDAEVANGDAEVAQEFGPGNLAANWVKFSKKIRLASQNEAIRTGHIKNMAKGKGNTSPLEIEGSEQDQNER